MASVSPVRLTAGAAAERAPPATAAIRKINYADLRAALAAGWQDFAEKRGDLVFIGVLYPAVGLLASIFVMQRSLLPVLFPMVAGLSLMGPLVAAGFYELARRREEGLDASWWHFLDIRHSPAIVSLAALGMMLLAVFSVWIAAAWAIYHMTMGAVLPSSFNGFVNDVLTTGAGWRLIVIGNLVGFLFAAGVLAISLVSFPMVVHRGVSAEEAVATSVRAVMANPGPVAAWGLIVAALLGLGSLPLFIGLAVVLPWLGYATWHLYRRMIG